MKQNKTICSICIMDESDPEITFDNYGVCNHCNRFESLKDSRLSMSNKEETLSKLIKLNSMLEIFQSCIFSSTIRIKK